MATTDNDTLNNTAPSNNAAAAALASELHPASGTTGEETSNNTEGKTKEMSSPSSSSPTKNSTNIKPDENATTTTTTATTTATTTTTTPDPKEQEIVKPEQQTKDVENQKQDDTKISTTPDFCSRCRDFYWENEFVILIVIVILLARAYPPLGADYLQPHITSTWIAVIFIFVLAGLGLKTKEFSKAFQRLKFNVFVQVFNLGVVSSIIYGISRGLSKANIVAQSLADGMVVCASLPLTINMVLVLTKSSGGDEASAVFNAAFGNMLGVFVSPVLILGYLGVTGDVALWDVFFKLALRVVAPVTVGQLLQNFSPPVVAFVAKYKKHFKSAQQYCLVFIVYTVFCRTFEEEKDDTSIADIFIMIAVQFFLLVLVMILAWYSLKFLFPDEPTLRVMGLYGCTHKTVAMGVPLINAIYEDNPLVGLYTLPLLIWHPMQLVVGSFLAPRLYAWVESEKKRLGWLEEGEAEKERKQQEQDEHPVVAQPTTDEEQPPLSPLEAKTTTTNNEGGDGETNE